MLHVGGSPHRLRPSSPTLSARTLETVTADVHGGRGPAPPVPRSHGWAAMSGLGYVARRPTALRIAWRPSPSRPVLPWALRSEKPRARQPSCVCAAYRWPHRPGGGLCRWPDPPIQRLETPPSTHSTIRFRRPARYPAKGPRVPHLTDARRIIPTLMQQQPGPYPFASLGELERRRREAALPGTDVDTPNRELYVSP